MMKRETQISSLAESVAGRLRAAGIHADLVSSSPAAASFGNAEATFRVGSLLLRFVRDRGQEFMDLASSAMPSRFFQFGDVEIAMGWKTIDEVLAKQEPEGLDVVLARLGRYIAELNDVFSGTQERLTRARVERAAVERGQAFVDRLRGKK